MEESEKMMALKKAYAETILNTVKEAAERIMVSERKALCSQQELSSTKEEAFRLLIHLKNMIDEKTDEAKITSSNQQRRIDVLEAQLHEAETIITNLRTELKWVRDKSENMKNNQGPQVYSKYTKDDVSTYQNAPLEPFIEPSADSALVTLTDSDKKSTLINQSALDNKCCNASNKTDQWSTSQGSSYAYNLILPSIIRKTKEPGLYRNGCTQRFRALVRNLLGAKLPNSQNKSDVKSLEKDDLITKTCANDDGKCIVPSFKSKKVKTMKKCREGLMKPKICPSRRRKTLFGKAKTTPHRRRPWQHFKSCQLSSALSHCKTYPHNGNVKPGEGSHPQICTKTNEIDMMRNSIAPEEQLPYSSSYYDDKIKIIRKGKRNMKVKSIDAITSSIMASDNRQIHNNPSEQSAVLTRPEIFSNSVCVDVSSDGDLQNVVKHDTNIKPLTPLDPVKTTVTSNVNPTPESSKVTVSSKTHVKTVVVKLREDREDTLLVIPQADSLDESMAANTEMNLEMVNVPDVCSNLKDAQTLEETNKILTKAENDKLFRYTFHRKRKKESSTNPKGETCLEKCPEKRRVDEKQNDVLQLQNLG